MKIIGEKINGTRKRVAQAIAERDGAFIQDLARRQAEAGAAWYRIALQPLRGPRDFSGRRFTQIFADRKKKSAFICVQQFGCGAKHAALWE